MATDTVMFHVKSNDLGKILLKAFHGANDFQILRHGESVPPDLMIFELAENIDEDFSVVASLLEEKLAGEVFLVSARMDPALLQQALRVGAREFFSLPLDMQELSRALDRFRERKSQAQAVTAQKDGRIISILGSKGGVGTTTVAVNLAVTLAESDPAPSVALMDMNTLFGEIPLFLEISPNFHWGEITKNIERLDNTFLTNVLCKHSSGVHVLPSPNYLNELSTPTPEIMERLIGLMKTMFDFVIIDGGQATDDAALKVLQMSNNVLMVSILSLPCLSNTTRLLRSFVDLGYLENERINVVLNRHIKKSEISLKDAEAGIGRELYWIIPNDYNSTMAAINSGKPLSHIAPKSGITKNFEDLAAKLSERRKKEEKKGWFSRIIGN